MARIAAFCRSHWLPWPWDFVLLMVLTTAQWPAQALGDATVAVWAAVAGGAAMWAWLGLLKPDLRKLDTQP